MTEEEKKAIRAICRALYVERTRFGKLDANPYTSKAMDALSGLGKLQIPHGGADVVDKAVMLLQALIGDEPTSVLDAQRMDDGFLRPQRKRARLSEGNGQ
jgi:hypothetical protein